MHIRFYYQDEPFKADADNINDSLEFFVGTLTEKNTIALHKNPSYEKKLKLALSAFKSLDLDLYSKYQQLVINDIHTAANLSLLFVKLVSANYFSKCVFDILVQNKEKAVVIAYGYLALRYYGRNGYPPHKYLIQKNDKNSDELFACLNKFDEIVSDNITLAIKISPALQTLNAGGGILWTKSIKRIEPHEIPEIKNIDEWTKSRLLVNNQLINIHNFNVLCQYPDKSLDIAKGIVFFENANLLDYPGLIEFIIKNAEDMLFYFNMYKELMKRKSPEVNSDKEVVIKNEVLNLITKNLDNIPHDIVLQALVESLKISSLYKSSILGFQQLGVELNKQIKSGTLSLERLDTIISKLTKYNTIVHTYWINSIIYTVTDFFHKTDPDAINEYANKLFNDLDDRQELFAQRVELAMHILSISEQTPEIKNKQNEIMQKLTFNRILILEKKPEKSEIDFDVIGIHLEKENVTAFWNEDNALQQKTLAKADLKEMADTLLQLKESTDKNLVQVIASTYGCTNRMSSLISAKQHFTAIDQARISAVNKSDQTESVAENLASSSQAVPSIPTSTATTIININSSTSGSSPSFFSPPTIPPAQAMLNAIECRQKAMVAYINKLKEIGANKNLSLIEKKQDAVDQYDLIFSHIVLTQETAMQLRLTLISMVKERNSLLAFLLPADISGSGLFSSSNYSLMSQDTLQEILNKIDATVNDKKYSYDT